MTHHPFGERLGVSPTPSWRIALGLFLIFSCRIIDILFLLPRPRFLLCSLWLWGRGLLSSPYSESGFKRIYAARKSQVSLNELVYGETPVFSGRRLLKKAGVNDRSEVLDLGAGRGRVLMAARTLGAEARGVELLDSHVSEAQGPLSWIGARLEQESALQCDPGRATHVYITWTCMREQTRKSLERALLKLKPGTVVIVVTWPILSSGFSSLFSCRALFTWGLGKVYVYQRDGLEDIGSRSILDAGGTRSGGEFFPCETVPREIA